MSFESAKRKMERERERARKHAEVEQRRAAEAHRIRIWKLRRLQARRMREQRREWHERECDGTCRRCLASKHQHKNKCQCGTCSDCLRRERHRLRVAAWRARHKAFETERMPWPDEYSQAFTVEIQEKYRKAPSQRAD